MYIDSVGLICQNPAVVVNSVIDFPSVCFLIDFGAEHSGNLVLDDLKHSTRMDNHKVDVYTSSRVTASIGTARRLCQSDSGIESASGDSYDSHTVIHFDLSVDIGHFVGDISGNVILQVRIDIRVYKEDSALIRDFLIVHSRLCGADKSGDIVAIGQGCGDGSASVVRIFRKTVIYLR